MYPYLNLSEDQYITRELNNKIIIISFLKILIYSLSIYISYISIDKLFSFIYSLTILLSFLNIGFILNERIKLSFKSSFKRFIND